MKKVRTGEAKARCGRSSQHSLHRLLSNRHNAIIQAEQIPKMLRTRAPTIVMASARGQHLSICLFRFELGSKRVISTSLRRADQQQAEQSSKQRTGARQPWSTPSFPPPSFPKAFGANQIVPLDAELDHRLSKILSQFPEPIRFAFAYGSGVFAQHEAGPEHAAKPTTKTGKKMIDVVMAVSHPQHWHAINMQRNKRHYSWIARAIGGWGVGIVQPLGAGLWYHPYVKVDDELIKYGVTDVDSLCKDLLDWDTLYISGRMHKPVAMLATDARVRLAQQVNLASALRTALLLLPEHFGEAELYTRIASISYTGDFRMSVPGGEKLNKVRNIVLAQRDMFRRLYGGLIRSIDTIQVEETRANRFWMIQDVSDKVRAGHASKLPLRLREKIQQHYTSHPDQDEAFLRLSISNESENVARTPGAKAADIDKDRWDNFWLAVVRQADFQTVLLVKIAEIVRGPAQSQSIKGFYTAGFTRTMRYVFAKIGKFFEGRRQNVDDDDDEKHKAPSESDTADEDAPEPSKKVEKTA